MKSLIAIGMIMLSLNGYAKEVVKTMEVSNCYGEALNIAMARSTKGVTGFTTRYSVIENASIVTFDVKTTTYVLTCRNDTMTVEKMTRAEVEAIDAEAKNYTNKIAKQIGI
jgi:hypothetical protein